MRCGLASKFKAVTWTEIISAILGAISIVGSIHVLFIWCVIGLHKEWCKCSWSRVVHYHITIQKKCNCVMANISRVVSYFNMTYGIKIIYKVPKRGKI